MLMAAASAFIGTKSTGSKVTTTLFILLVSLLAQIFVNPFAFPIINVLEACALLGQTGFTASALGRLFEGASSTTGVEKTIFDSVALFFNMPFALVFVGHLLDRVFYAGTRTDRALQWFKQRVETAVDLMFDDMPQVHARWRSSGSPAGHWRGSSGGGGGDGGGAGSDGSGDWSDGGSDAEPRPSEGVTTRANDGDQHSGMALAGSIPRHFRLSRMGVSGRRGGASAGLSSAKLRSRRPAQGPPLVGASAAALQFAAAPWLSSVGGEAPAPPRLVTSQRAITAPLRVRVVLGGGSTAAGAAAPAVQPASPPLRAQPVGAASSDGDTDVDELPPSLSSDEQPGSLSEQQP
jgi:hypothetical protein